MNPMYGGQMTTRLAWLNALDRAAFASALDGVFEHSPWVAERAWEQRPFQDLQRLHEALLRTVQEGSDGEKLQLIRAHPELAGPASQALTRESAAEQTGRSYSASGRTELRRVLPHGEPEPAVLGKRNRAQQTWRE